MVILGTGLDKKHELNKTKKEIELINNTVIHLKDLRENPDSLKVVMVKLALLKTLEKLHFVYKINQLSVAIVMLININVSMAIIMILASTGSIGIGEYGRVLAIAVLVTISGIFLSKAMRGWVLWRDKKLIADIIKIRTELLRIL